MQGRREANHLALEIFQKSLDSWKIYVENRVQLNDFFWFGWIQILVSITILKTIVYRDNNWKMFQKISKQGMHESISHKIYKESQIYKKTEGFSVFWDHLQPSRQKHLFYQFVVHYTKKFKPQKKGQNFKWYTQNFCGMPKGKEIITILEKITYQFH